MNTNGATPTGAGENPADDRDEIVVGIDESPSAVAALLWAVQHARVTGSPLRLVYAWRMPAGAMSYAPVDIVQLAEAVGADARARATRWVLDVLGGGVAEVIWRLEVTEGEPGPALVRVSRGARLLVLGTQEHRGLRRAVSGSVSHYCISHADVPVIAVPAPMRPVTNDRSLPGNRGSMVTGPLY